MDVATVAHSAVEGQTQLRAILQEMPRIAVAFSGGVDSSYLLAEALRPRSSQVVAVTGTSSSLSDHAAKRASRVAHALGASHLLIPTHELDDPRYVANGLDRCFFCKGELFRQMKGHPELRQHAIIDGFNHSDHQEHRPGHAAAKEAGVRSPLAEAGLTKPMIRKLSAQLGLETASIPASPCLASRIQPELPVTKNRLFAIENAEVALMDLGFTDFRVRYTADGARIEVCAAEQHLLENPETRRTIESSVVAAGFKTAHIDSRPLASGSMVRDHKAR